MSSAESPAAQTDRAPLWPLTGSRRFLLHTHVIQGIGVAGIGVDRGQSGPSRVCRVDSTDDGWVVALENVTYGLSETSATTSGDATADPATVAARDSFAESVLATVPALPDTQPTDTLDPSLLALLDHFQVAQILTNHHKIAYAARPDLSRIVQRRWYDDNLVIDAVVSYGVPTEAPRPPEPTASGEPAAGPTNRGYPAPGDSLSVTQRIILQPLPRPGFAPMPLHPRQGSIGHLEVHRFDRIGEQDAREALAPAFRLTPGSDNAPIIFRLDAAVPEPYRSAILTGANWWQDAFARAGFPDTYRVEVCPDGEDLFDPRFGTITWTHRLDRGWSFGGIHADPRTGEILKGCVRLGSQRIEEVRAIAQAVLGEADARHDEVEAVLLQRLSQLAAHEVGHSLGFAHNFATQWHPQLSVMDYPGPIFDVADDGRVIVGTAGAPGRAYPDGLGPWDYRLVAALYAPHLLDPAGAPGCEADTLDFVTDADSRLEQQSDARGSTWKAGGDPRETLARTVGVRRAALASFSAANAPAGEDSNEIARRFRLLYLVHRFHAVSVLKSVGGTRRKYAQTEEVDSSGGFAGAWESVPENQQLEALRAVADLFSPEFLEVPAHIVPLLVPPSGGVSEKPGGFENRLSGMVDVPSIVRAGADAVLGALLAPERLNRVVEQSTAVLRELLEETVRGALRTIDTRGAVGRDGADDTATLIAWAIIARFRMSVTSTTLHVHARFSILHELEDVEIASRLLRKKWESLVDAAMAVDDPLPEAPVGTPI
ncbi:zinc-dependent metalloprotease [Nakamurella lactea]|uniref:zinc-dependent metalloprotease n=1 Tax=Nakamurella lactea TaxID=459515 RepID=UPI00041E428F|nr:zinc-dependent metalloprotease [Nakamurella lactea]